MSFHAENCSLCPRRCGANRTKSVGRCHCGEQILVTRADLHPWEEPCISSETGSGTVFFCWLCAGLRFLPKSRDQPPCCWQASDSTSAYGYFFASSGKASLQFEHRHRKSLYALDHRSTRAYKAAIKNSSGVELQRLLITGNFTDVKRIH